jgi:outer membrane receptor protein involved in Fe transport
MVGGVFFKHDILQGLQFTANADVKYQSSYNTGSDHDPVKTQPGFALVDGRIGIGQKDGGWALELWATNLFNTHYIQTAFDAPIQTLASPQPSSQSTLTNNYDAYPGQPRFWGVTVQVRY